MLGIDPGTRVAGYGLVEAAGSRLAFVAAGVWTAPRDAPLEQRLASLAGQARDTLREYAPDCVAMEDVFVKLDPKAALAVGQGRGALLSVVGEAGLQAHSYAPARVKKAVAGNGKAAKEAVARMVGAILGLSGTSYPLDATDALAVAIAHALALKPGNLSGR